MTTPVPGHLFAIHGKLQHVAFDAVVIPTDTRFHVAPGWQEVTQQSRPVRPERWDQGYGRAGDSEVWFIDVTDDNFVADGALIAKRVGALLKVIKETLGAPARGRVMPVVAMPLLASGSGGQPAGHAVNALIGQLELSASTLGIDIALCLLERDRFEAVQYQRRKIREATPGPYDEVGRDLGALAMRGALALMIGAGVSMAAGLPSWDTLLERLAGRLPQTHEGLVTGDSFKRLPALDKAELMAAILGDDFQATVVEAVRSDDAVRPSLAHFLLAGLRCPQVATTNYDLLYEVACTSQGAHKPAALPREVPEPGASWILKLHGDVDDPARIVLSRRSFIGYDAQQGPAGALFQSMLMTRHVLFVGLSFTDDNLLRLTHEAADFLAPSSGRDLGRKLGSVITLGHDPAREELWKRHLAWRGVTAPADYEQFATSPDETKRAVGINWRARELEVLIDSIAVWGTPDDGIYLDRIFTDLLDESQRKAAEHRRAWERFRSAVAQSAASRRIPARIAAVARTSSSL